MFLIRTDDLGNKIWENNIGGERTDVGLSVDQADDSGYVITGYTSLPGSDTQVYLVKTDPFGNKVWENNFGGANFEEGRSVKHTSDEGYIVAGTCNNGFGYLVYLVKTDSSGNKVWEKTFGPYEGRDVQQTSDSGYVVVGSTSTSENGSQVYLIKLKSNYPSNIPAIPSGQTSGILGASYTYSTSATDPDGDQISYTFDWGDGTKSTTGILDSGSIANASHIWNHAGIYEVKAKATDSKGLDSEWSNAINVSIADLPYISGTKFNDTNSNATRDPGEAGLPGWTIRLTRPDGTTVNATTDASGSYKFENLTSGTYRVSEIRRSNWTQTYPAWLGDHIINVTDGSVTGVDFGNNYLPVPDIPFPPSGPASGIPGAEYSYSTSSTDPNGEQISYTFDWGDGSNSTTGLFDSGAVASATHIWNSSGVYQVRAMATNSKGASSGWSDPLVVSIANPIFGWKALGGVITSSPSAIMDSQDKTEVWVKGGDNALWLNIDGSWQGKGGYLTSDPFAAEDYNGRIHVLARGGDNGAWDFICDPVTQSGEWVGLGGYITEGLTAASDPANHNLMRVAARGGDEALWTCDLDINAKSSSWSFQGGVLTSRPYIIFDPSGGEHILVKGGDNALWDRNGEWTGSSYARTWSPLGGILANPIATTVPGADSRIAVFAKGGDDAVWMCDVDSSSETETGSWHRLGGVISSDIFAVADSSGSKIHTFARGSDMALWENAFTTSPWNPDGGQWQCHNGLILDYRPGATLTDITQAFVIGAYNGLWQNTQATASTTAGDARSIEIEAENLRELNQNKLMEAKTKLEQMKSSIADRQMSEEYL